MKKIMKKVAKSACIILCVFALFSFAFACAQEPATVTGISVSGMKTEFEWGEDFVFDAVIKESYANGIIGTGDVSKYMVNSDAYDSEVAGTYTIVVTAKDDPSITTSYEVTVASAPVTQGN